VVCDPPAWPLAPANGLVRVFRVKTAARQRARRTLIARLALARDGYALVKCELAVFKPEG